MFLYGGVILFLMAKVNKNRFPVTPHHASLLSSTSLFFFVYRCRWCRHLLLQEFCLFTFILAALTVAINVWRLANWSVFAWMYGAPSGHLTVTSLYDDAKYCKHTVDTLNNRKYFSIRSFIRMDTKWLLDFSRKSIRY